MRKDRLFNLTALRERATKFKKAAGTAWGVWREFYDVSPGDPVDKALEATKRVYNIHKKQKGKK